MGNFTQHYGSSRILKTQSVAVTSGTISQSAAAVFSSQTYQVRIATNLTAGIWVRIGDGAQTAVAGDTLVCLNFPDYFTVTPGQTVAFISTSTSSGIVSISEMT
jgi:plastocyanin